MTCSDKIKQICKCEKLRVINIGLEVFYDALVLQNAKAAQIDWTPPVELEKDITEILDDLL